ncbi:MAG: acyl-CoA dehydrogenase family protein, partial [Mycobacterium sp.]|nr:acyl-CoA dehydrogenase family protein [Mycobacterium sp.]
MGRLDGASAQGLGGIVSEERELLRETGAAALVVPEELGGAGGELGDAAVVLEELGKALVPTPLLGTTLAELALLAANEPDTDALERLAEGRAIGTVVFDPRYVVNGDVADFVIAANGTTLSRWTSFTSHRVDAMDLTRRLARLEPTDTVEIGDDPGLADIAAILLAAEQIGAAAKCLDMTVEYTKDR